MIFETTLNLNGRIYSEIVSASEKTNITKNYLIKHLLKFSMKDHEKLKKERSTVKYQRNEFPGGWKQMHVWFSDEEYVFCIDMRRFFRMSVSFVLAYAVRKYLNIIVQMILNGQDPNEYDNYQFYTYEFKRKIYKNSILWNQKWIKHQKKLKPPK